MAKPESEELPSMANDEDKFGPPHAQSVSETLQFWILLPGILLLALFVGMLAFKFSFVEVCHLQNDAIYVCAAQPPFLPFPFLGYTFYATFYATILFMLYYILTV